MMIALDDILEQDMETFILTLKNNPLWVETPNETGEYPIFIVARRGYFNKLKAIVETSKCSMNKVNQRNQTVLHYAALSNQVEMVDYVIDRVGEDPFKADCEGQTTFDVAEKNGCDAVYEALLKRYHIKKEDLYRNPIVRGFHPDPSIVNVGEDYYMVMSSFVYFPSIPIYHSRNLLDWEIIGHAVTKTQFSELDTLEDGRGIWAPDISYYKGCFYITATLRMNDDDQIVRRQLIVRSQLPQGPYSEPVYIDIDGIDPSLFHDSNGKHYMLLNRGARLIELNDQMTKAITEPSLLWYGSNKHAPEAPHLLKHNGYYYCVLSEGGTGRTHQISIARSKRIHGPYEAYHSNPILVQRDPLDPIQRSGHGKLFIDHEGNWWIVYLASRPIEGKYSILGRETCLDPVVWGADGWPIINGHKGPSTLQIKPQLTTKTMDVGKSKAITILGHDWVFVRTPDFMRVIQDMHNQTIKFYPDHYDLNHMNKKNIFVTRRTEYYGRYTYQLKPNRWISGCEFGLTAYYDTKTYIKYGIKRTCSADVIFLEQVIGDQREIAALDVNYDESDIEFCVKASGVGLEFGRLGPDEVYTMDFIVAHAGYLSDEGLQDKKRFTGSTLGVYGIGFENSYDFSFELIRHSRQEYTHEHTFNRGFNDSI